MVVCTEQFLLWSFNPLQTPAQQPELCRHCSTEAPKTSRQVPDCDSDHSLCLDCDADMVHAETDLSAHTRSECMHNTGQQARTVTGTCPKPCTAYADICEITQAQSECRVLAEYKPSALKAHVDLKRRGCATLAGRTC